jgi:hypothetical protein
VTSSGICTCNYFYGAETVNEDGSVSYKPEDKIGHEGCKSKVTDAPDHTMTLAFEGKMLNQGHKCNSAGGEQNLGEMSLGDC